MFNRFNDFPTRRIVPFSNGKYRATIDGKIESINGALISPTKNSRGELVVMMDWCGETKEHAVALIIAHTFKPTKLPLDLWLKVSVLFADDNSHNVHPSNLVWKFPTGFMEEQQNGFAYIPMFTRYLINRQGEVFDRFTGKFLGGYRSKGYYRFSVIPDIGPRVTLPRHRALCMAFKDYPSNVDELYVDHVNGVKGFDDLDNLEWVTPSENRKRAIKNGQTLVNKPIIVSDLDGENEVEYPSIKQACDSHGLVPKELSKYLSSADEDVVVGNKVFRLKYEKHAVFGNLNKCPILVRNMRTGAVIEFASIVEASKKTGLTKATIGGRIDSPMTTIYPDHLQIKRKSDETSWYIPKDLDQETLESIWAKMVLVKDLETGVVREFVSQRQVAIEFGLSEASVYNWVVGSPNKVRQLPNGKLILIKRKSDLAPWRDIDNPREEYENTSIQRAVLVRDVRDGSIREYASAQQCAAELDLLTTTLNWRLKSKGQKVYVPGYQFRYKNETVDFKTICPVRERLFKLTPSD